MAPATMARPLAYVPTMAHVGRARGPSLQAVHHGPPWQARALRAHHV